MRMISIYTLPKEMYAEISRFLWNNFPGKGFRRAAGTVQIRDILYGATYLNGVLHSFDDSPAIVLASGNSVWYRNGKLHRDNGPAMVYNGSQYWYQLGALHRENMPAIIYANGTTEYWLNGIRVGP